MKSFSDLINNKESSLPHSKDEINYIVNSYTSGNINDDEMTAWLKAVYKNSMNIDETISYTDSICS